MKLFITGTPGVGKTVIAKKLAGKWDCPMYPLKSILESVGALTDFDRELDTFIVDEEKVAGQVLAYLETQTGSQDNWIVEGHLTHLLPPDIWDWVVVLRAHPKYLKARLEARGYSKTKVSENVEAEVLAVVPGEIVEWEGPRKIEVRTGTRTPDECVEVISAILDGPSQEIPAEYQFGNVNWLDDLDQDGTLYEYLPLRGITDSDDVGNR